MTYSLQTERNHFYSWAACRAAQAGPAKARRNELLDALSHSGIIEYLQQQPALGGVNYLDRSASIILAGEARRF